MRYAELHAKTNFSFLEGASHPDELVQRAAELGYAALAITDRNSLAGVVRAHVAAKPLGLKLLIGAEITPEDAPPVVLLATDRASYGRLARLITRGRRRAEKGECQLAFQDLAEHAEGLLACMIAREGFGVQGSGFGVQGSGFGVQGSGFGVRGSGFRVQEQDGKLQIAECKVQNEKPGTFPRSPRSSFILHPSSFSVGSLEQYRSVFGDRCYLLAELHRGPDDEKRLERLMELSRRARVPLAAASDVHYHVPERRALHDVLVATRYGVTVAGAGEHLFPNAQRHLKSPEEIAAQFARAPDAVRRTLEIAGRVGFSLDELRYEYPEELVPPGTTPIAYLAKLAWAGARKRYPRGIPEKVRRLVEHELRLIEELHYEAYFLTVWDLVRFARSRGILCQGRGSAANSAVCYCLGITAVDPERMDLLFERFVSRERNEAPDIDVDFEHQRREEVLQYLYEKYGRDRAGMTAEVITYRPRSAVRDVGKALGMPPDRIDRLAKSLEHFHAGKGDRSNLCEAGHRAKLGRGPFRQIGPVPFFRDRLEEAGIDPKCPPGSQLAELAGQLVGFPRHLSQHTGGMVMTRGPLCELVPIENAAMPERTVIQWNKDDLDELGILKVDCLALGMLSAIHHAFDLIEKHGKERGARGEGRGARVQGSEFRVQGSGFRVQGSGGRGRAALTSSPRHPLTPSPPHPVTPSPPHPLTPSPPHPLTLANIPQDDPEVYAMIRRADTMGVFQIESRAQMSMLPRLKPRSFYDLVIEVALVRPGPIQGNMVHPYLRRRSGEEPVSYPSPEIRQVLEKTLGVPLFQEQAMRLAVVAAGFTPGEADQLRHAMGAWRRPGIIDQFHKKLIDGMLARGMSEEYAEAIFRQIRGFGDYGFPESHAASFALLVYVSAWLKYHYPAAFTAALLNSQPMGFYAPAQLVRNAREHGVEVRPVDVNASAWDCTLEAACGLALPREGPGSRVLSRKRLALRLGFRMVSGLAESHAGRIVAARGERPFRSMEDFTRRTGLGRAVSQRLARAGAFGSLGLDRRGAVWHALAQDPKELPLFDRGERTEYAVGSGQYAVGSGQYAVGSGQYAVGSTQYSADEVPPPVLPKMNPAQEVLADYRATGLSLKGHPMEFLRQGLERLGVVPAAQLKTWPNGKPVRVAGIVLVRQRPGTAKGITFVTLEDETGQANLIIRPDVWRRYRQAALGATILLAAGRLQREGLVIHVLVTRLENLSERMEELTSQSRDFC